MPTVQEELERLLREYIETLPWYKRWAWKAWLALNPVKAVTGLEDLAGCLLVLLIALILGIIAFTIVYIQCKRAGLC
jgi:hypothetical protein